MLTSEEVTGIINKEIEGHFDISNLHGLDLNRCLIKASSTEIHQFS